MGGEGSVVLSLVDSSRRRVILQDLITLRARFASFFRCKLDSYKHIFENLFEVIETPQWNEESTLVFDQLKEYADELHRLYTSNTGFVLNPHCPNCATTTRELTCPWLQ